MTASLLQIGGIGPQELAIIFLIAVLLFGANKIPKLARSTGQAMGEFQRGREEVEEELKKAKQGASTTGTSTADTESSTDGGESTADEADAEAEAEAEKEADE